MHATSVNLLERLRSPGDHDAWGHFVRLYTPFLYHWIRQHGLSEADATDLIQEVFLTLMAKLPEFRYNPAQRFRGWLWTVTANLCRAHHRRAAASRQQGGNEFLEDLAGPDPVEAFDRAEYRQYLAGRALQLMQDEFHPATWRACWLCVVEDRPAADVARELGLTVNAVYLAKARVLSRLRQELDGLLD